MVNKTDTLESLCELIVDCPHSTPKWTDDGIIVLRNQNIRNGVLDLSSPSFTNEEDYQKRIKRAIPQEGDIVFTREAPMGEVCLIPKGLKCCLGQRQVLLRPKKDVSGEYIFWALQSPFVQHQISWNEGTGTTVSNVRIPVLKALKIPRHPQDEDVAAKQLTVIAQKIELNRQTNQTLEKMAQALFKSWFVDFDPVIDNAIAAGNPIPEALQAHAQRRQQQLAKPDHKPLADDIRQLFPSEFEETELSNSAADAGGWVPKGWKVINVENLVSRLKAGKRYAKKAVSPYGQVPVYEQGQSILLGYHDEEANFLASVENPVFIFGDHTCVTKLGVEPFSISANVIPLKGDLRNTYWTYFAVKDLQKFEEYRRHWMEFAIKPVVLPSVELADFFADLVKASTQKAKDNDKSCNSLARLRDTLLPKLISGELRIPEAQQLSDDLLAGEIQTQKEGCL